MSKANTWEEEAAEFTVVKESWEDEGDDNVKDEWDADEEAEVVVEKQAPPKQPKTKTPTPSATQDQFIVEETPQERRRREERMQRESDLDSAMGLFGIDKKTINVDEVLGGAPAASSAASVKPTKTTASSSTSTLESLDSVPSTQAEFDALAALIVRKVERAADQKLYPQFLESLFRTLMQSREAPEVRKVAGVLNDLATNKQKERLVATKKKPAASLAGAKKGSRMDFNDYGAEYDDFE